MNVRNAAYCGGRPTVRTVVFAASTIAHTQSDPMLIGLITVVTVAHECDQVIVYRRRQPVFWNNVVDDAPSLHVPRKVFINNRRSRSCSYRFTARPRIHSTRRRSRSARVLHFCTRWKHYPSHACASDFFFRPATPCRLRRTG